MNLCFVCNEYPPGAHGGIGSMTQTLGRALAAAGHRVRVVGCYPDQTEERHWVDEGVHVHRLPTGSGRLSWMSSRQRLYRRVAAWAASGDIDIVEVPDWQGWAAFWPRLDVPVVTRLNGSATYFAAEMGRRAEWITTRFEGGSLRRADFIASVSRYTAERTREVFAGVRAADVLLPNPVAIGQVTPWEARDPLMVVYSGTLTEKKGVIPLAEAWPLVVAKSPGAMLHFVGKDGAGPQGGSMIAHLKQRLGPTLPQVHFHGHVPRPQVIALLGQARVAVFPSFAEAFAIAPLEAMAAGVPTISSALGSGPEGVRDGIDGMTADPSVPESIASAILRLLDDEVLSRQFGEQGRARVESAFSIDRLRPANEDFFASCVQSHRRARAAWGSRRQRRVA